MLTLTNKQARQFILLKHGLLGAHKFIGKQGALEFVRQAGCIQFDPVDSCGKNAELTLQSRVKNFTKQTLSELLYTDRSLVDFPDKNLSIFPTEDWPYFQRYRQAAKDGGRNFPELEELEKQAIEYIRINGAVSSDDLPMQGSIHWHSSIHWSGVWNGNTNAARAVLEQLYSTGVLIIHHKNGSRKYYDLAEKYLPAQLLDSPDPLPDDFAHKKWRVLRRIGAVGLLWNRPSDAWLNIWDMKSPERIQIFKELLSEGKILAVQVENEPGFYAPTRRDFSEAGTEAFEAQVPEEIRQLARTDCGAIHQSWVKNGSREQGNWKEMFGSFGAELCSAWAVARYIDEIAAGGKEIYDIFMYTNVWMDRNSDYWPDWNTPAAAQFPSAFRYGIAPAAIWTPSALISTNRIRMRSGKHIGFMKRKSRAGRSMYRNPV